MAKEKTPQGVTASGEEAAGAFVALGARKTDNGYEVVEVRVEDGKVMVRSLSNPLPRAAAAERLRVETVSYMRRHL